MPENNSFQQHSGSCLKYIEKAMCIQQRFFLLYCTPEERPTLLPCVSLDLISSFLLKIHPKQHFTVILQHVVDISLFCVLAWSCGLIQNVSLNWCVHSEQDAVCCVCVKSNIKEWWFFFFFWHLQIKRDMSYLCSSVAAKSLSPCGTKQGFVVGFARAAQCFCVKHPKL